VHTVYINSIHTNLRSLAKFDYKQTLDTIIRKFTNYRNSRKRQMEGGTAEIEIMKVAAAALVDLKSFSKGRSLFRRERREEILARRSEILENDPKATPVGAYQVSLKELWEAANQKYWEQRAAELSQDIYEWVIFTLLCYNLIFNYYIGTNCSSQDTCLRVFAPCVRWED
jgi:hypothetical protein